MVLHKEYALRRFCEVPLKHKWSKILLEKFCANPDFLKRVVFVSTRAYLTNTMLIAQAGAGEVGFELQLGAEVEHFTLVNGGLKKERRKVKEVWIADPLEAWEVLQNFRGLLHVQLVFRDVTPDWYEEIVVPNEAIPQNIVPGFAAFVREQIDLILWAITLREQIEQALRVRDEQLFRESVKLYKEVCQSCFWKLS